MAAALAAQIARPCRNCSSRIVSSNLDAGSDQIYRTAPLNAQLAFRLAKKNVFDANRPKNFILCRSKLGIPLCKRDLTSPVAHWARARLRLKPARTAFHQIYRQKLPA